MKIEVDEEGDIILKEVFSGVGLETEYGEKMGICMRDSGFEFSYAGECYSAQQGVLTKMERVIPHDAPHFTGAIG